MFVFSLQFQGGQAVIRENLQGLSSKLAYKIQYKWINQRILSMEDIWVKAGRSLSAKYDLKGRKAKQVLYYCHQFHSNFYSSWCSLKCASTLIGVHNHVDMIWTHYSEDEDFWDMQDSSQS